MPHPQARTDPPSRIASHPHIVTAMVSAFVPLTDDMTAYRNSMLTSCVLGAVALVSWIYLRRKAR